MILTILKRNKYIVLHFTNIWNVRISISNLN
jgi:hypothetical protein